MHFKKPKTARAQCVPRVTENPFLHLARDVLRLLGKAECTVFMLRRQGAGASKSRLGSFRNTTVHLDGESITVSTRTDDQGWFRSVLFAGGAVPDLTDVGYLLPELLLPDAGVSAVSSMLGRLSCNRMPVDVRTLVAERFIEEARLFRERSLGAYMPIVFCDAAHVRGRLICTAFGVKPDSNLQTLFIDDLSATEGAGADDGMDRVFLHIIDNLAGRGLQAPRILCVRGAERLAGSVDAVWDSTLTVQSAEQLLRGIEPYLTEHRRKSFADDFRRLYAQSDAEGIAGVSALIRRRWHDLPSQAVTIMESGIGRSIRSLYGLGAGAMDVLCHFKCLSDLVPCGYFDPPVSDPDGTTPPAEVFISFYEMTPDLQRLIISILYSRRGDFRLTKECLRRFVLFFLNEPGCGPSSFPVGISDITADVLSRIETSQRVPLWLKRELYRRLSIVGPEHAGTVLCRNFTDVQELPLDRRIRSTDLIEAASRFIACGNTTNQTRDTLKFYFENFEDGLVKTVAPDTPVVEIFNEYNFLRQADLLKRRFESAHAGATGHMSGTSLDAVLKTHIYFYRYMVFQTDMDFPAQNFHLRVNKTLLKNKVMLRLLREGFYFTCYMADDDLSDKSCVVMTMSNMGKRGQMKSDREDFKCFDLRRLAYPDLNRFIWLFIRKDRCMLSNPAFDVTLNGINAIFRLKGRDLGCFSTGDAVRLLEELYPEGAEPGTAEKRVDRLRVFLMFLRDSFADLFSFEAMFFEYFKIIHRSGGIRKRFDAVDSDAVRNFMVALGKVAGEDNTALNIYAIFFVLMTTPMRFSAVLRMKKNELRKGYRSGDNYAYVTTPSRTSKDEQDFISIPMDTHKMLQGVIRQNDALYKHPSTADLGEYVFLRKTGDTVHLFNDKSVTAYVRRFMEQRNIRGTVNAQIMRRQYMTKAVTHVIRNNLSQMELKVLTHHKNVAMTIDHYDTSKMDMMMSSLFGIVLDDSVSDADIGSKVESEEGSDFPDVTHEVEGGCGVCVKDTCTLKTVGSCLTCKNFKTTVAHAPFFMNMIDSIDQRLLTAQTEHDRQDLLTVKTICVKYLEEIHKRKSGDDIVTADGYSFDEGDE